MWTYNKGFLTQFKNTLVHIKNDGVNAAELFFTFPDHCIGTCKIYIRPCGVIVVVFDNGITYDIYCLFKNHPKTVPTGNDFPKIKLFQAERFITFYPGLTVFSNLRKVDQHYLFGPCLVLVNSVTLYYYCFEPKKNLTQSYMPTVDVKWETSAKMTDASLKILLPTEPIINPMITHDVLAFQQGSCLFALTSAFSVTFLHGGHIIGKNVISVTAKQNTISTLTMRESEDINKPTIEREYSLYSVAALEISKNRGFSCGTITKRIIDFKIVDKIFKYSVFDGKYQFETKSKLHREDVRKIPGGLIVLNFHDPENYKKPTFEIQGNVLIASFHYWTGECIYHKGGILQYADDEWFYLSLKKQTIFETFGEFAGDIDVISCCDDALRPSDIYAKFHKQDSPPMFFKLKTTREISDVKLQKCIINMILIKTFDGFYCFDGHTFVQLHEQINLALKRLPEKYFATIDIKALARNSENPNYANVLDGMYLLCVDDTISREYRLPDTPYDNVAIIFDQNDKYLDTAVMGRMVHKYNIKLSYRLIGAGGSGPIKLIASTIINELFDTYFKFDGFFLIPRENFRSANSDLKFILGWVLHNSMYILQSPISHHLPLALLAAISERNAADIELDFYAKLGDINAYEMFNSSREIDLVENGYETKRDWLSMICRYSDEDVQLYKPFAAGFKSFTTEKFNPISGKNIVTIDRFISGLHEISAENLITRLINQEVKPASHRTFIENLTKRLIEATQPELKNLVFNISGTYHFNGNESVTFNDLGKSSYKFAVCARELIISSDIDIQSCDLLIEELFKPQQANMRN
jgi:hypothetical protein